MGSKLAKKGSLSNKDVKKFSELTQLQPYFIRQLYDAFIDRTGKNGR